MMDIFNPEPGTPHDIISLYLRSSHLAHGPAAFHASRDIIDLLVKGGYEIKPPNRESEMTPTEKLITQMIEATFFLNGRDRGGVIDRIRFAVSAAEYAEIEDYVLKREGKFSGRVANIPLIVVDDPRPELRVIYADDSPSVP